MKHTPGPWNREKTHYRHAVVDDAQSGEWKEVAVTTSEANAYLIAAAPEMLKALESVLQDFSALNVQHEITLRQVMAAIKKAKGEL